MRRRSRGSEWIQFNYFHRPIMIVLILMLTYIGANLSFELRPGLSSWEKQCVDKLVQIEFSYYE